MMEQPASNVISHCILSLAWLRSDYAHVHWHVGHWGQKEGLCESLDSYLTLSIFLTNRLNLILGS